MEEQNLVTINAADDKSPEIKRETELKIQSFVNQESSGDWNVLKRNSSSFWTEKEEMKSSWKIRNLYSVPDSKFQAYWQDRFSESTDFNFNNSFAKESNFLSNFRDFLATYQESSGTPPTEYSFVSLIKVLGEATGKSLLALIYIIVNTAPVAEIFLYILRFLLDKLISIRAAEDYRQLLIKSIVLSIQVLSIYVCLAFIFGFILMPIVQIVFNIMTRVMLFDR